MSIKKIFLVASLGISFLLSGCNSERSSTPEGLIKTYYSALQKNDFKKAFSLFSDQEWTIQNKTIENQIQDFESIKVKDKYKMLDYQINGGIKDYDDAHKWVKVDYRVSKNGQESGGTDTFMLVMQNGKWKLDSTLVVSRDKLEGISYESKALILSDFYIDRKVNGLGVGFTTSAATNDDIYFGWVDRPVVKLTVDSGETYTFTAQSNTKLSGNTKQSMYIPFDGAKGTPIELEFNKLFVKNGLNGPYSIKIQLKP